MNSEQITNIAIKIGEIGAKANFSFWIAIISAVAALSSALIAGLFAYKLNLVNKQHEKQWAYVAKVSLLIDNGIEIFSRMLFNKLSIVYYKDINAYQNLFLLQKDILVVESQLVVYGTLDLADAVYSYKNLIIHTPDDKFLEEWQNIYKKGHEMLLLCRKHLGMKISEKFEDFTESLTKIPPKAPEGVLIGTNAIGAVTK